MRPTSGDDAHRRATRAYRWIVRLYPASYRRLFGEQMLQTFQDHYRDAVATGEESVTRFWLGVITDEVKALPRARLAAAQETWRRWSTATQAAQGREEIHIMTVFRPRLRKYWYLYLIPILLIPTAATLYGQRKETVYESTALINVVKLSFLTDYQANTDNPFSTQAQNVVDAMTPYLDSPSFMAKVAARTSLRNEYDLTTPAGQDAAVGRIAGNVTVSAPGKAFISVIADDHREAVVAQELAQGVIDEFNATYAQTEKDYLTKASDYYKKQADALGKTVDDDIAAIANYLKTHPTASLADPTLAGLNAQLAADQKKLTDTNNNLDGVNQSIDLASNGTPYDLSLQDPPTLPKSSTVKISRVLVYPIGALIAILVLFALTGISYRSRVALE